jgi:hypothetical protein
VSKTIDDARRLIGSRLAEIEAETRSLERAVASLGEGSAPRRRPGRSPKTAGAATPESARSKRRGTRKPQRAKRAARGRRRDELLAAIKTTPGARPSELARVIGVNPPQVHALIAKLRAEKVVVKSGKGYALKR